MRILHPTESSAPSQDNERLGALEAIVRTLLQRLRSLEERVGAFEAAPPGARPSAAPSPETSSTPLPLTIDTSVIKKGLLHQMWKYMNDERHPPAA